MALIEGYSSSEDEEEEEKIPDLPELQIFSQNYTTNMVHQGSVFSCIRWNPSVQTLTKLKAACSHVLKLLPPNTIQHYQWIDAGRATAIKHHITVHNNYRGEPYQINGFTQDLIHALPQLSVPKELIGPNVEELERKARLLSLLGEKALLTPPPCINLHFDSHLRLFPGLQNDSIFLSGLIKKTEATSIFFERLRDVLSQIRDSNGLVPSMFELPPNHQFHISFQLAQKPESDRVSIDELNDKLKEIDVSSYLQDIVLSFDSLDILPLLEAKEQHIAKFNTNS